MNIKKYKINLQKGFTLAEMMIVMAIIAVVGGIILFNYDSFRSNTTVNTVAQEMALTVRKAQSYALGLQTNGILATLPVKGYGIRLESARPDQITFFTELAPSDNQFTSSSPSCGTPVVGDECLEYYKIETGDIIDKILVDSNDIKLTDPNSSVDIIFKKPTGDTVFCVHMFSGTCSSSVTTAVGVVEVYLVSQGGITKIVRIYSNGQISVE